MASVLVKYFKSRFQMGRSTGLGVVKNINLYPARLFTGTRVLGVCIRLQILMITPIIVHNGIFIGEVMGRFTGVGVAKIYTCIKLGCLRRASF